MSFKYDFLCTLQLIHTHMLYLLVLRKPWRYAWFNHFELWVMSWMALLTLWRFPLTWLLPLTWCECIFGLNFNSLKVMLVQNDNMCMAAALFGQKTFMVTIRQRSYLWKYICIQIPDYFTNMFFWFCLFVWWLLLLCAGVCFLWCLEPGG